MGRLDAAIQLTVIKCLVETKRGESHQQPCIIEANSSEKKKEETEKERQEEGRKKSHE